MTENKVWLTKSSSLQEKQCNINKNVIPSEFNPTNAQDIVLNSERMAGVLIWQAINCKTKQIKLKVKFNQFIATHSLYCYRWLHHFPRFTNNTSITTSSAKVASDENDFQHFLLSLFVSHQFFLITASLVVKNARKAAWEISE